MGLLPHPTVFFNVISIMNTSKCLLFSLPLNADDIVPMYTPHKYATQNEDALSHDRVRGQNFLVVIFAVTMQS